MQYSSFKNGDKVEYNSKTAPGSGLVALNKDRLLYQNESTRLGIILMQDSLPFPISVSLSKVAAHLLLPLVANPDSEPLSFCIWLSDFVMSNMLWSLFSATVVLHRDQLFVAIDIYGSIKFLTDLFSPDA